MTSVDDDGMAGDTALPMHQFVRCPRCGLPRAAGAANPFHCGTCGFTYYFNTASAVAAFIEDGSDRCLFIRRAREPARGKLALPGGFTDLDETAEQALRREIQEELGLELGSLSYVGSWPNRYHANGFVVPVLDLFFHAVVDSPDVRVHADEVSGIEWLRLEEVDLGDLAFASMRTAVQSLILTRRDAGTQTSC
jgi:ADP-ribose pyrophosphatase YjhB (NUDIX family)